MGVYAQLDAQKKTFNAGSPLGVWLEQQLAKAGVGSSVDPATPAAAAATAAIHSLADSSQTSGNMTLTFGLRQPDGTIESFTTANIAFDLVSGVAVDAVHIIATDATDHTGGDFKITVTFASGESFETAAVAHNATAATLEAAIDTAATAASITGWVNGHISVSASVTDLQDGTLTLTFDGASVDELPSHPLTVMSDDSRTGGASASTLTSNGTVCVQASIDIAAAAAAPTGWNPGDIVVTGTSVNTGPLTLTYTGLVGQHSAPVLVDVDGAGGAWGATSITTPGQIERAALGVLLALNVISGSVADQDAATSSTSYTDSENRNHNVPANVVKALMREAAFEDANNATYHSIDATLYGAGEDRSPMVEERVTGDNTKPV